MMIIKKMVLKNKRRNNKKKDERKIGRNVLAGRENSSRELAGNSRQIFRDDTWLEVEHHQSKKAT